MREGTSLHQCLPKTDGRVTVHEQFLITTRAILGQSHSTNIPQTVGHTNKHKSSPDLLCRQLQDCIGTSSGEETGQQASNSQHHPPNIQTKQPKPASNSQNSNPEKVSRQPEVQSCQLQGLPCDTQFQLRLQGCPAGCRLSALVKIGDFQTSTNFVVKLSNGSIFDLSKRSDLCMKSRFFLCCQGVCWFGARDSWIGVS